MDELESDIGGLLKDAAASYAPPAGFRDEIEARARRQAHRARTARALAMAAAVAVLLAGVAAFAAGRGADGGTTVQMPAGAGSGVPGSSAASVPGSAPRGTVLVLPCSATTVPGISCPWMYADGTAIPPAPGPAAAYPAATCPDQAVLADAVRASLDFGAPNGSFTVQMFVCLDDWVQAGIEPSDPSQGFLGARAVFHRMNGRWTLIQERADPASPCDGLPAEVDVALCPNEPTAVVRGDLFNGGIPIVGTTCTQVPATTAVGEKSGGHIVCDHDPSATATTTPALDASHGTLRGAVTGSGVPLPSLVDIKDATGSIAVATGPDGWYGVVLTPGRYELSVVVNKDVGIDCGTRTVEIVAGQTIDGGFTCTAR